ncbi:DUF6371 domain-containing protein [Pontibacter ramchanderi]|uniref:Toprim domain-containing protein n=1 Tax=Pontibacter ramchanderi TaxID=1179743 RepID=A0A2N3V2M6_9BACT|nr:DUF6371 domain-containing protein [Pontibacter ramchanderi]PKV75882.1 hypothetical protein BD749_0830 [Pontibacter ramchanderi]
MSTYRYTLQPYGNGQNTRFTCPACGKTRQLTRYIDTETGEHLHEAVGSCNRVSKCGYHYTPKLYFADHPDTFQSFFNHKSTKYQPGKQPVSNTFLGNKPQPISYMPLERLQESRRHYNANNFAVFLRERFGKETAEKLIARYHIGTSRKWLGATVFWLVDQQGRIRSGKIMLYDKATGKRIKHPFPHFTWVHTVLKLEGYHLKQCLFGEHLLGLFPGKPVAVVESEKTAVICSVSLPRYIWLAVGGISQLTAEKCAVLTGRQVTLFPDLGGYGAWKQKAQELQGIASFIVSDILERIASKEQQEEGLDIADFLLKRKVV